MKNKPTRSIGAIILALSVPESSSANPIPGAGDSIRIDSCQWGTGRMAAARFARIQPDGDGLNVELTQRAFVSINGAALSTDDCQPGFRFRLDRGDSVALGFGEAQVRLVSFTATGQPAFGCEELDPYATGPFGEVGTRIFSAARIEGGRLVDVSEAAAWDGLTVALGHQKRLSPGEERRAKSAANGAAGIPEAVVSPNGSLRGETAVSNPIIRNCAPIPTERSTHRGAQK